MEKITCLTDNNEPVVFFVLEQTRINGKNYLLVTDVEDENVDADAYLRMNHRILILRHLMSS